MIKWIIFFVLLLIFLGYIGFDVRKAVEAPTTQSNLTYVKKIIIYVWDKYLEKPAIFIWNEIIIKFVWNPIKNSMSGDTNSKAPVIQGMLPTTP